MRLLLDAHALVWWLEGGSLSDQARSAIADDDNDVLVSVATAWELAIKAGLGKLRDYTSDFAELLETHGFAMLGITLAHTAKLMALPAHHRDPFDRMLVAQALSEQLTIVTRDPKIRRYEVPTLSA